MEFQFSKWFLFLLCLLALSNSACVHDHFASNATFHYYNDLAEINEQKQSRLLQTETGMGKMRIFMDYSFMQVGGSTEINLIKRAMNISANYFYNIIQVNRLSRLQYPSDSPKTCNILTVPTAYVTPGVVGDLGILVSNEVSTVQYMAKSTACALLKSNNRPLWGVMIWNNKFLEFDQVGFQKVVYVAIHEIVHTLGFSAALYDKFPAGNPYRNTSTTQYLTSPTIQKQIQSHFGCASPLGIILEDQDGTLIPSHNEKKVFGNEFMISSAKKGAYFSRATLALLASTGWYNVSYIYAQSTTWGKNKNCSFLNIDNCVSNQFCTGADFACDWDVTAMGRCNADPFTGSCKLINYFTNTICTDQNYELKNLNAALEARERGGYNSKCFSSNYRKAGSTATTLNNRCYVTVCSATANFLYILIGSQVLFCSSSNLGMDIPGPDGLIGTLKCPSSFANYCEIKQPCTFHCNKNGACINGQCLCTGSTTLTSTCLDSSLSLTQINNTGGLLNSIFDDDGDLLILHNSNITKSAKYEQALQKVIKVMSNSKGFAQQNSKTINSKCFLGTFFDPIFGDCTKCMEKFGCESCTIAGCLQCPLGKSIVQGRCVGPLRI